MKESKTAESDNSAATLASPAAANTSVSIPGLLTNEPVSLVPAIASAVPELAPAGTLSAAPTAGASLSAVSPALQASSVLPQVPVSIQGLLSQVTSLAASSSSFSLPQTAQTSGPAAALSGVTATTFPIDLTATLLDKTVSSPSSTFSQAVPSGMTQANAILSQLLAGRTPKDSSTLQPAVGAAVYIPSQLVPPAAEVAKTEPDVRMADADEPYDPEDAIMLDIKEPEVETEDADSKKPSSGDDPYDPEDDFVLDLIEDISLPTALKKIDKPNVRISFETL